MTGRDKVFDFLRSYIGEHGYAPSVRDICEGTGLTSTSTVYNHLVALRQQGRVQWAEGKSRTLRLVVE